MMIFAASLAAALLVLLSVPALRRLARHARERSLHARIRRRLGASVGSVVTPRRPALLPRHTRR